jgi:hypothetical protein
MYPNEPRKEHGSMPDAYELSQLDSHSFEHMVNFLALKVLGKGVTGFVQGADGGRDGYLIGEAPYPTAVNCWNGTWYIQSKFHKPHLSKNPQAWLINEVKKELEEFENSEDRVAPDIWIIATNIEPSGKPTTGAYDAIKILVEEHFGKDYKFDIWGGKKILDFLAEDPNAASYYGHFLTPGNVLSALYNQIGDSCAQVKTIINSLILDQFNEQIYTKLEQAGSAGVRPKIHQLFVDLPVACSVHDQEFEILNTLVSTSANVHKPTVWNSFGEGWRDWANFPKRARIILLKGGPGQGKSTAGQFYSQIQRAALLLEPDAPTVMPDVLELANEFINTADKLNFKPSNPRIPISIELKDFATWYGTRKADDSRGIISYLCDRISQRIDQRVEGGTLKRALSLKSWFINFDGLDEVPNDVKDEVANEITRLANITLPELDSDTVILCTTRPQGYSGQFEQLKAATLELTALPPETAMNCAAGVIKFGRTEKESEDSIQTLVSAMESPQVRELMTTPLQSHIMAVVVRDGGRPPEKRWELFENFYQVMKKRESLKNFPDVRISKLLRENSTLLKAIHARLGIVLHARAEISIGADTTLERKEFCELARHTTERYVEENVEDLVETLMEATVERLVFVNTPESSTTLRFDIRQLQEFFAGEFIYSNAEPAVLRSRLEVIGGDSHWREVMHFATSALVVNMRPTELAIALEVICGIDDSDISHHIRTLKRRMGIGSILALRLLCEGVLEQDKVVRLKFKEALTPLYSMIDNTVLSDISIISHPNSMAWLLNCMVDALFEYSEPETIGAAIVLGIRLPDTHARKDEVAEKLFASSPNYIQRFFKSILSRHYSSHKGGGIVSPQWVLRGAVNLLIQEDPKKLDLVTIIRFVRYNIRTIEQLAFLGLNDTENRLLLILLEQEESYEELKKKSIKRNGLTMACRKHTWLSKTRPTYFELENFDHIRKSPILELATAIIKFTESQSIDSLKEIISFLIKYDLDEGFLPSYIQALIPLTFDKDTLQSQLTFFQNTTQAELKILLSAETSDTYNLPNTYEIIEIGTFNHWKQLEELASIQPEIAISLWLQAAYFDGVNITFDTDDSKLFLYNLAKQNAKIMLAHFTSWGKIFETLPDHAEQLKSILLTFAAGDNAHIERLTIHAFAIKIPEELDFLPLVALAAMTTGRRGSYSSAISIISAQELLEPYGLTDEVLGCIYLNESYPVITRAAALSCYLSRADDDVNTVAEDFFSKNLDILALELATENLPGWYVSGLVFALEFFDHSRFEVMEFAGKILHAYRENYNARTILQALLSKWRERSVAPVQSKNILTRWLNE